MTENKKGERVILDLLVERNVISWIDDIGPAFRRRGIKAKFSIWNLVNRGVLIRLGRGAFKAGPALVLAGIIVVTLIAMPAAAQTRSRSFYGANGSFAGSSVTRGHSSSFYGSNGGFAGSAVRNGNSQSFYDEQGRFVGSSVNTGPRR
jgi:hypothetical protein